VCTLQSKPMMLVKTLLLPGTLPFAILVAAIAALFLRRSGGMRRWGVTLLILLPGSYFILSLPYIADRLAAPLMRFPPLSDWQQAKDAAAIVALAGDSRHARVLETLRLSQALPAQPIILSGPDEMREDLVASGVSPDRIVMESASETTREQALNVARIVRLKGFDRVVLVASAIHMPRALATFRAAGVNAVPSASATRPIAGLPRFRPAAIALRFSGESLYEYAALVYYRLRGWR